MFSAGWVSGASLRALRLPGYYITDAVGSRNLFRSSLSSLPPVEDEEEEEEEASGY